MGTKRALEQRLSRVGLFDEPRIDLEQYPTPPDIAAHIVHLADLYGDVADRVVFDLGTGPGILALGCALRGAKRVVGLEIDPAAIAIARENERRLDPGRPISWVRGDATEAPLCPSGPATVLMNPPFGAQRENVHADRAFLATASQLSTVSYSLHNAGSRSFIERFAADHGGTVSDAMAVSFDLARQFTFHDRESVVVDAELYRIEWPDAHASDRAMRT